MSYDLMKHLTRQRVFSEKTFGPGQRTKMVLDHIRKELVEIEGNPLAVEEWIDVVLLAFDGAWRTGATLEQVVGALVAKQMRNEQRQWPDWRTVPPDQAIEHVRGVEEPKFKVGDVLRYASGETALFKVTLVRPNHGGHVRYYGTHCMGGYNGAYEDQCSQATAGDLATFSEHARWRIDTVPKGAGVVGVVED